MRKVAIALLTACAACADADPVSSYDPTIDPSAHDERGGLPVDDVPPFASVDAITTVSDVWARRGPPYPVVLVHGFSGWNDIGGLEYFFDVRDDLVESRGEAVYTPALPPYNASMVRAQVLAQVIDDVLQETGKAKVHLIGHSQGGLDAREVVSTLGYGDRVATLTTVSTPHKGTPVADTAEVAPDGTMNLAGRFLGWLIGSLDGDRPEDATAPAGDVALWQPQMQSVITFLSTTGAVEFNARNPDDPRVAYFSTAGVSNLTPPSLVDVCADAPWGATDVPDPVDPLLLIAGEIVTASNGIFSWRSNDGLVPVDSAVHGTFLGCVPADHFDEIGQVADLLPEPSGFDHVELYRKLVDHVRGWEAAQTSDAP